MPGFAPMCSRLDRDRTRAPPGARVASGRRGRTTSGCRPAWSDPSGPSTVREFRLTLSDLDHVTVRVADVAARLAVFVLRLRDELGPSAFPQVVAGMNIRDADVHKAADPVRVGED